MKRRGLSLTLLLTSLSLAGSVFAEVRDGQLGSACTTDAECTAPGVTCSPAESGVPGGLCSKACEVDKDCRALAETAVCNDKLCRESCVRNSWFEDELDPSKCHGREDTACIHEPGVCLPQCATDNQCAPGGFCSLATGLCSPTPELGTPPGSACEPDAAVETCAGLCIWDDHEYHMSGLGEGICYEPCVIGAASACDGLSASDQERACLAFFNGLGVGDLGSCVDLCDCSSECREDQVCRPFELGAFEALGVCQWGPRPEGAADCLDAAEAEASCPYGLARPCRSDACLGVARCQPSGDYGPCECIDDGPANTAGAAGASSHGPLNDGGEGGELDAAPAEPPPRSPVAARTYSGCACRAAGPGSVNLALGASVFWCLVLWGRRWRHRRE